MLKRNERAFVRYARSRIGKSIPAAKALESDERRAGKKLTNGPVARLLALPTVVADVGESRRIPAKAEILLEDRVNLLCPTETREHILVCGKTRYLDARREWPIFKSIREEAIVRGIDEGVLYGLFHHSYAAIAVVRSKDVDNSRYVLAGVRSAKLGSAYGSAISFPGGLVDPGETLEQAAMRELREESGLRLSEAGPSPFARHVFDNAASTTFGRIFEIRRRRHLRKTTSHEMAGRKCVWIPEAAMDALAIANDSREVAAAFGAVGIHVEKPVMAPDAAAIYCQLRTIEL